MTQTTNQIAPSVPVEPAKNTPSQAPQHSTFFKCFFWFLIGVMLVAIYATYDIYTFLSTPAEVHDRQVVLTIKPGATFDRVAWDLKKEGVITDVTRFRLLGKYNKAFSAIRAGQFLVHTSWTPVQVLDHLLHGKPHMFKMTLREGLTWWQTAQAIEDQGFAKFDDFAAVIHDPAFLAAHAIPFATAEGFLFPNTYLMHKPEKLDRAQAEKVADILIKGFWRHNISTWKRLPARSDVPNPSFGTAVQKIGKGLPPPPLTTASTNGTADELPDMEGTATNSTSLDISEKLPLDSNTNTPTEATPETVDEARAPRSNGTSFDSTAILPGGINGTTEPALQPEPAASGTVIPETVQNGTATTNGTFAVEPTPLANATQSAPGNQVAQATPRIPTDKVSPPLPHDPSEAAGFIVPESPAHVSPEALNRLVTLASLVERETGVAEERARVAGVYVNRLRTKMLLQCDPTVIYGEGPEFTGPLRYSHLRNTANKYNTYQHPGLPPSPISSVGKAALQAALLPEQHTFFYFVATGLDRGHTFSKTLQEHNKAVRLYRARTR